MSNSIPIEQHQDETAAQILEYVNSGEGNWVKGWNDMAHGGPQHPKGPFTRNNALHLTMVRLARGYSSRHFFTSKQATAAGCPLDWAASKGRHLTVWAPIIRKDKDTNKERFSGYRAYRVYNGDLCQGWADPVVEPKVLGDPSADAMTLASVWGGYSEGGNRAAYSPSADRVMMPPRDSFKSLAEWTGTILHEKVHQSGHRTRLERDGICNPITFGNHRYAVEEIIAESGAAFVMASLGLLQETGENHGAYLRSWLKEAGNKPADLLAGMGEGLKAAAYLMKAAGLS